jgi:hypothetical protein
LSAKEIAANAAQDVLHKFSEKEEGVSGTAESP